MKANRITMTITVEVLSIDSIPSLIEQVRCLLICEHIEGSLVSEDGDEIRWKTEVNPVVF